MAGTCWGMQVYDRNGPKWSASVREKRGDKRTETDLNGRLLPGKKGDRGREDRYGPKWPAPVGECGVCDRNGPKWSASVRGERGDGGTETDLNGRLLPGNKKGDRGRENRYGPKWPAPVGVCGVCDRNGPKWSASVRGRGVMEGQRRIKGAGSCEGKTEESERTGTDLNGRRLLGYVVFF